jgi:putative endonuclease
MPRQGGEKRVTFTTYILQNIQNQRYYIGSTNDLDRRLSEHNRGQTRSTNRKGFWIVIYTELFQNSLEAHRRELKTKSYKGGNAFKKLIKRV